MARSGHFFAIDSEAYFKDEKILWMLVGLFGMFLIGSTAVNLAGNGFSESAWNLALCASFGIPLMAVRASSTRAR